jgi:4-diphosphocytidyl-2-C-methyl-D-erythritol kinase
MISFPNAKINMGLRLTGKRDDGYHYIQSLMIPVGLCDILEIIESDKDDFQSSGLDIPGNASSNLVIKAVNLIRQNYSVPPLKIHLHKIIPMGGGLGGGSSDAAFMIRMLNEKFSLNMDGKTMKEYASQLGSDCSFFIENKTSMVSGVGEILSDFSLNLKGMKIVLIDPGFPVSTSQAYSRVKVNNQSEDLSKILSLDMTKWKKLLKNDFENSVFEKFPELNTIKKQLYDLGAGYASMSGSGSVMFGLFEKLPIDYSQLKAKVIFKADLSL